MQSKPVIITIILAIGLLGVLPPISCNTNNNLETPDFNSYSVALTYSTGKDTVNVFTANKADIELRADAVLYNNSKSATNKVIATNVITYEFVDKPQDLSNVDSIEVFYKIRNADSILLSDVYFRDEFGKFKTKKKLKYLK